MQARLLFLVFTNWVNCRTERTAFIINQNQACGRDNSVESSFYRTARARRPIRALSLPDAPCERIDIRELTENLTNNLRKQVAYFHSFTPKWVGGGAPGARVAWTGVSMVIGLGCAFNK